MSRRAAPRSDEQCRRFLARYAEGASNADLTKEFSLRSHVSGEIKILRAAGHRIPRRPARPRDNRDPYRLGGLIVPTLPEPGLTPATLMDASGRVIGTMSPITRERRFA